MQTKTSSVPKPTINHTFMLDNQTKAQISGVLEVISATEKGVLCKLSACMLQIMGENLRVEKLLPEEKLLTIVGNVYEVKYSSNAKTGFFKKLFR